MTRKTSIQPNKSNRNSTRKSESGNVFLFILIGIVLFAAISFVMSRGFRSEGTSKLDDRKAELLASEIMNFGSDVSRAVNRLRNKNISESDLDFRSPMLSRHSSSISPWSGNPNCTDVSCRVFKSGGISERTFEDASNGLNLPLSSSHPKGGHPAFFKISVRGIGTDAEDLVMMIPALKSEVCDAINKKLGRPLLAAQPQEAWGSFGRTAISSTDGYWLYSNTESSEPLFDEITALVGTDQGCYKQNSYGNSFYKILIAR